MELQTELEPLRDRCNKSAMILVEKILRRENNFLSHYRPAGDRLKTHRSFLSITGDLYDT